MAWGCRARGSLPRTNGQGRASRGEKQAVNGLMQETGGERGAAKGGSLKVPFWGEVEQRRVINSVVTLTH